MRDTWVSRRTRSNRPAAPPEDHAERAPQHRFAVLDLLEDVGQCPDASVQLGLEMEQEVRGCLVQPFRAVTLAADRRAQLSLHQEHVGQIAVQPFARVVHEDLFVHRPWRPSPGTPRPG
jgi:hypothetical protein